MKRILNLFRQKSALDLFFFKPMLDNRKKKHIHVFILKYYLHFFVLYFLLPHCSPAKQSCVCNVLILSSVCQTFHTVFLRDQCYS